MDTTKATNADLQERIRQLEAEIARLKRELRAAVQKVAYQELYHAARDPRRIEKL